ncbi:MAG: acyl-CoA dehydrogenase family protein [Actinomycetota bacterium]|nr:acyl-CoA dehydrogenase family protein [Actinomycetota bacterium]
MPGADQVQRAVEELLAAHDPAATDRRAFLEARFDAGLAWVHYPPGAGGLGLDARLQRMADTALHAAGAPRPDMGRNIIGLGMAAPTLAAHGTPEQHREFLRPLYAGEIWCQLFSEPGAGSDLAGLATRAVRDGDEWVVNGQKVWTTLAHMARWGLLVARTDPDVPKHRGLTYFICDMCASGVEVRPLRQITGEAEFNEVYLTDVRLPDRLRLGEVGDGWRVSMTTLMHERVAVGSGSQSVRGGGVIANALRLHAEHARGSGCPRNEGDDAIRRDDLMRLWVEAEVLRLTQLRATEMRKRGTPGPEGSVSKLAWAELNQRITNFCVNLMGPDGALFPSGYEMRRPEEVSLTAGDPRHLFLRTRANSIEGGTSEVLRNILAERVLGLPGDPRVDKDLPWRDVPRS